MSSEMDTIASCHTNERRMHTTHFSRIIQSLSLGLFILLCISSFTDLVAQSSYSGIWRAGGDEKLWVDANLSSFSAKRDEFEAQGYTLVDVEINAGAGLSFSAIWHREEGKAALEYGLDQQQLFSKLEDQRESGKILADLEAYVDGGKTQYLALWKDGSFTQVVRVGISWDSLKASANHLRNEGFKLADVETYQVGGTRRFAGVWDQADGFEVMLGRLDKVSMEEISSMLSENYYNLIDIEHYDDGGTTRYIGIWREDERDQMMLLNAQWNTFLSQWRSQQPDATWLIDIETPSRRISTAAAARTNRKPPPPAPRINPPSSTSSKSTTTSTKPTTTKPATTTTQTTKPSSSTTNKTPTGNAATGQASYYGDKFQGKPTASGEPYDHNKYTCAHREYKFGTMLRVTNIENGKSVDVRVNDRGPFKAGRIVDLSRIAAEEIGIVQTGLGDVKVEVLR